MIVQYTRFDTNFEICRKIFSGICIKIVSKIHFFNILARGKNEERAESMRLSSFFALPWKGNFSETS